MKILNTESEVFVGNQPDPSIDEAQAIASTQHEDQNDDPETTPEEKARIWKLLGMDPNEQVPSSAAASLGSE
jgi:hypothetical protein